MSTTIRKLVSEIRGVLKENTTDSVLTNRDIWNVAWAYAVTFIQREVDTKRNIFYLNIFKSFQVNFKEVPITDGSDFDLPIDCIIYKSINKIPEIVESKFGYIVKQITTLDRSKNFDLVTPQSYRDKLKITKGKGRFVFIENGYMYSNQRYPLLISGLFSNINFLLKDSCKVMDLEAPIPEYIVSSLLQTVPQQFGVFKQVPQDTVVNTNPNN